MDVKMQVQKMDEMVSKGDIVNAVKDFFATEATTSDYGNVATSNKDQMVAKMTGFVEAISSVNGITHHRTIVGDNATASEFTFDFDMKDGSKIYWHEIIRRIWNEQGEVIQEQYFNA
ncbi:MAG: hypothetical protein AAFX87_00020 [Bacteroidota bacterium]